MKKNEDRALHGKEQKSNTGKLLWKIGNNRWSISCKLIENDILLFIGQGKIRRSDIVEFMRCFRETLANVTPGKGNGYYRIHNWKGITSASWRMRALYISEMIKTDREYPPPCRLAIIFGASSLLNIMINISKRLLPFPVNRAKDLDDALEIISKHRRKKTRGRFLSGEFKKKDRSYSENELRTFTTELLQYIGNINWAVNGINFENIKEPHPLKEIFDALYVVKTDFDSIMAEIRESKKKLEARKDELRFITESSPDTIFLLSKTGKIIYISPSVKEISGYSPEEVQGTNFRKYVPYEEYPKYLAQIKNVFSGKSIRNFKTQFSHRNGKKIPVEVSGHVVRKDGEIMGQGTIRNLSNHARKEAEMKALETRIMHADRLTIIGQLSSGVAHELNEPLSSILGFAELIKKSKGLTDTVREDIEKIIEASLHARKIIKNLLMFSRQAPPKKLL